MNKEDKSILLATQSGIVRFDCTTGKTECLIETNHPGAMIFSMVTLNGKLYAAIDAGIFAYDLKAKTETWYPMEYEDVLNLKTETW